MSFWRRWLRQPQSVWVRKAMFQVHLWTGIGVGLYVLVVCVSGSAVVFRPELSRSFFRGPVIVAGSGSQLSDEELKQAAGRAYPAYKVSEVRRPKEPDAAVEVSLDRANDRKVRLLDPFTGKDLGPAQTFGTRTVTWLLDLHDNLLGGGTGRLVNGVGGLLLTILALTGLIIWWPGIKNWRRSLTLQRGVNWKRFTWDLHSSIGFWTFVLVFMWAFSGFYLVFQELLSPIVDYLEKYDPVTFKLGRIEGFLAWLPRLHFGRFRGMPAEFTLTFKILWVVLGLAPAVLSITGGLMWFNRVVRIGIRQSSPDADAVPSVSLSIE